ncbi:DUF4364 family protein [Cuneatibacter sp. NSJ-177]|uniref:DUF4364 family protein n=1 Tax=Cuneatibacter sp. NSJ-177 TaxID=2931401 RepID=UPI001FD18B45|nr:DUF4364 family protein [Cuneatibacter sp. NSJ-177]MCJ7837257.1 DUF4364 family protein [Cuneatibacter sp. NSJ-177]
MLSDPLTLYKLMILYLLKQAKFPLSNSQLSEFFLEKEYTTYFTLQEALNDLLEAHLMTQEVIRNSSRYEITREGEETLVYFGNSISEGIIEDMDKFLKENKIRLRNEVGIVADYYKSTAGDFMVECEVREGKSTLIKLELAVPSEDQAELMCDRWQEANQTIYAFLMKELLKE